MMFDPSKAKVGDEVSASITVRGGNIDTAVGLSFAAPALSEWQALIVRALPSDLDVTYSDTFVAKPQGEYSATRTLKVIEKAKS